MLREMTNFKGINWWTLLAGIGLNFIMTMGLALASMYYIQGAEPGSFMDTNGIAVLMLVVFLTSVVAGWIVAKVADNVPLKHVLFASMGAAVPYLISFFLGNIAIMLIMMSVVAVAGNLNGAMLAAPRRRKS